MIPAEIKHVRVEPATKADGHACVAMLASQSDIAKICPYIPSGRRLHSREIREALEFYFVRVAPRLAKYFGGLGMAPTCICKVSSPPEWGGQPRWVLYHGKLFYDPFTDGPKPYQIGAIIGYLRVKG